VSEQEPRPEPAPPPPPAATPREAASLQAVLQAGVQFLEAVAGLLAQGKSQEGPTGNGHAPAAGLVGTDARTGQPVLQLPLPSPELMQRGAAALGAILRAAAVGPKEGP